MDHYFNQYKYKNFSRQMTNEKTEDEEEEEEESTEKKSYGFFSKQTSLISDIVQENKSQTEEEKEDVFRNLWRNLRKQNRDFEALFENFSISGKIENDCENFSDKEKLEFMFIVHAYEDHRIRHLADKFETLQFDYQQSLNKIGEKESKLSRAETDCCRLKEDCLLLLERNESLIKDIEKLKKEKENVDKYEKSQIEKITEEKNAIINNLEMELDRLHKSSQQKIDEIKCKYVQEIDLLKSNYKNSIEKLEKERDEVFKEKEDLEKENGLLKAELNSIKIKKINSINSKKDTYNTMSPIGNKIKKLVSDPPTKEGKAEDNNKIDSKNNLVNDNSNNNLLSGNSIDPHCNSLIILNSKIDKNTNTTTNNHSKRRSSNLSMSPINSKATKNLTENQIKFSDAVKQSNLLKMDGKETKDAKETSMTPIKVIKNDSISFCNEEKPLNALLSFMEEKGNFCLNKPNEIQEEKMELENNLFNLDNYSNNCDYLSLNSSLPEEEHDDADCKSENGGVPLDAIFGWDEADNTAERRKSARMSDQISGLNAKIDVNKNNNFNNANLWNDNSNKSFSKIFDEYNHNNSFLNNKDNRLSDDLNDNEKFMNMSAINTNYNNLSHFTQQPQSYNSSIILDKLDSKFKEKTNANNMQGKSNIRDIRNLSAISGNAMNNYNQGGVKPRGKLSILYNSQGVLNEKERERPKRESVVQQIAFNLKINIKQKKNNFNYNNFLKQLKKNDNKKEKATEIVSKKYEMRKNLNSNKKLSRTSTIDAAKNDSSICSNELLDDEAAFSANSRKSKASLSIVTPSSLNKNSSLVVQGKESAKNIEVKNFKIEEKANETSNQKPEENLNVIVDFNNERNLNNSKEEYKKKLEAELNSLAIAAEKKTKDINKNNMNNKNNLNDNKGTVSKNPNDKNKLKLEIKEIIETYNSNISLNSNNNNSIIDSYTPCCEAKEYSFDNSYCLNDENNPLGASDIRDDGLFNFKFPDNFNTADEEYYEANNVIRFGHD